MALREEFERTGNWLFRWRSYLPILLILPMLLAMRHFEYLGHCDEGQELWSYFCLGISLCGLAIRILTVGHTPKGTSGRNTKRGQLAEVLNTTGVYSMVRHPLYLGNSIIWFGISMFCLTWWLSVIFMLAFWVYYERIMFAEEEFLRQKFGQAYMEWADRTPAFIPNFVQWQKPSLPFSLQTAIRREYGGLFAIIACFYALEVYEHIVVEHQLFFEPRWTIIFLVALVMFLTLRIVKRNTTLLRVQGR